LTPGIFLNIILGWKALQNTAAYFAVALIKINCIVGATTLSLMTFGINDLFVKLVTPIIVQLCHNAESHILFIVMLNVVILSVIMLNVIILTVVMLSVVMLSVVMLSVVMLSVVRQAKWYKGGARKPTGDNLKVVEAEFSTLSLVILLHSSTKT
jgi:hypothetical protein